MLQSGQGSIAYELLLLQQRLDAYEQLHIEEMAELREKIERLRRAFLQETNPQMHILAPGYDLHREYIEGERCGSILETDDRQQGKSR